MNQPISLKMRIIILTSGAMLSISYIKYKSFTMITIDNIDSIILISFSFKKASTYNAILIILFKIIKRTSNNPQMFIDYYSPVALMIMVSISME